MPQGQPVPTQPQQVSQQQVAPGIRSLAQAIIQRKIQPNIQGVIAFFGKFGQITSQQAQQYLQQANQLLQAGSNRGQGAMPARSSSRRTGKMDLMTGFTGSKPPDLDLGLKGGNYFEKWTTVALPDTGKNSAVDDEDQPTGSGAPATTIPGAPLKVPMEADDVKRPKIRDGREASIERANMLRKVALKIRRLDPQATVLSRRLLAAADEISYDALSTASLDESGDEENPVDDYQDKFGHGTLQFWGTDPARSTSLSRESSRRRADEYGEGDSGYVPTEVAYRIPGKGGWKRKICKTKKMFDQLMAKLHEEGDDVETRTRPVEGDQPGPDAKLEFANRGASRRRAEQTGGMSIDWKKGLQLVDEALAGRYPVEAVAQILKSDYDRTMELLKSRRTAPAQPQQQAAPQTSQATASRRRRSRTEGDKPLHPLPTVGDQDGPGAEGTAAFIDESRAPLQTTMTADDVKRPKIRDNPEASRSMWAALKRELIQQANTGGKWNDGCYRLSTRDYGHSMEVEASITDRENMHMPIGSVMFTVMHDSPNGRYASVEINDSILENRSTEFTVNRPRQATLIVAKLVGQISETAKDIIESVTV